MFLSAKSSTYHTLDWSQSVFCLLKCPTLLCGSWGGLLCVFILKYQDANDDFHVDEIPLGERIEGLNDSNHAIWYVLTECILTLQTICYQTTFWFCTASKKSRRQAHFKDPVLRCRHCMSQFWLLYYMHCMSQFWLLYYMHCMSQFWLLYYVHCMSQLQLYLRQLLAHFLVFLINYFLFKRLHVFFRLGWGFLKECMVKWFSKFHFFTQNSNLSWLYVTNIETDLYSG